MAASGLPFDDIRNLLPLMPPASQVCVDEVLAREAQLAKPRGSLGRMEAIVEWLAAWQGRSQPLIQRPLVALFLANHGVAVRNVSASPTALTRTMLESFAAGGAAVNQICATYDVGLKVFELALDVPRPRRRRPLPLAWRRSRAARIFWRWVKWALAIQPVQRRFT